MNAKQKAAHGRKILAYQKRKRGPDAALARLVGQHMIDGVPAFTKNNRAAVALGAVKAAHDALSAAIEDPDGTNDAEHDAAVRLCEELNAYYDEVNL